MSINKPRLAYSSWYPNLTGVSIPNSVVIGDGGDFSGKFSIMPEAVVGVDELYKYDFDSDDPNRKYLFYGPRTHVNIGGGYRRS